MSSLTNEHLYKWVLLFMKKNHLFPNSKTGQIKRAIVAMSGGQDSVLLYHLLCHFRDTTSYIDQVIPIHVDHALREESSLQAKKLQEHYPELVVEKIKENPPRGNIEKWARTRRYQILKGWLEANDSHSDLLYLGHHIDDSFEWFLHLLLSSSGTNSKSNSSSDLPMGIPLIHGSIRRPLHCLTKKQISYFVRKLNLFYVQDKSNDSLRFKRNFLRHEIIGPLKMAYPKAMAHFVERANQWALKYNQTSSSIPEAQSSKDIRVVRPHRGMAIVYNYQKSWSDLSEERLKLLLRELILTLSQQGRGELRRNLQQLVTSLRKAQGPRGPLTFSGGVEVYIYAQMLLIRDNLPDTRAFMKKRDRELALAISEGSYISKRFGSLSELTSYHPFFPFVIYRDTEFSHMGKKAAKGLGEDQLFVEFSKALKDRGLSYRPWPFLRKAYQKLEHRKKTLEVYFIHEAND